MSKIVFTREVNSAAIRDSELVDEVLYNDNTRDLYVDLDPGDVYKYSNVPAYVVDEFEKATSAGSFYNSQIKRKYGPGQNLGRWTHADYEDVPVQEKAPAVAVTKGSIFAQGGLITVPAARERDGVAPSIQTPSFSLKPFSEDVKVEGVEREYVVTFEVDGIVDFKRHTLKSTSVDEAVKSVLDLGKMLDLNFVVREVTIRFE